MIGTEYARACHAQLQWGHALLRLFAPGARYLLRPPVQYA
jgi:hypothetical protein